MKPILSETNHWVIPYFIVKSHVESMKFYQRAFNFPEKMCQLLAGSLVHMEVKYQGQTLITIGPEQCEQNPLSSPAKSASPSPMKFFVYTSDIDPLFMQAKAEGTSAVHEPEDMFRNDRIVRLRDLDDYELTFAQEVGEMNYSKIPVLP